MTPREYARNKARQHEPINFFYKGSNFQLVGTHIHSNGSCSHDIKNLDIVDPTKEKYDLFLAVINNALNAKQ